MSRDVEPRFDAAWAAAIQTAERAVVSGGVPGVTVAASAGAAAARIAFGVADVRTAEPMRPSTVFQLGSLTKLFVAAALLHLVEEGQLDVDEPVSALLDFSFADAEASRQMTPRHFLSHSSGVADDSVTADQADVAAADLVSYLDSCRKVTVAGQPGERFRYCSPGWVVLARLMEVVTGLPWHRLVRERVLAPLGLTVDLDGASTRTAGHAFGHLHHNASGEIVRIPPRPYPAGMAPSGGAHANVDTLLAFGRSHLPTGRRVLTPETLGRMREPVVRTGSTSGAPAWGLGWALHDWQGECVMAQGGLVFGQVTLLMLLPNRDSAIAVAANSAEAEPVCETIARAFVGEVAGVRPPVFTAYELS